MSDFPFQIILFLLVPVAVLIWASKRKKRMMAEGEQMYAKFKLADVSQRMGLAIVEGDPNFNMMMAYAHHQDKEFKKTETGILAGDDGVKESKVLLRGTPNGRPTEFLYYYKSEIETGYPHNTLYQTFDCRLSLQVARPFPPFEVLLRSPVTGMESPPKTQFPPASFGDPMLDAKFILLSTDPRIGPAIAPIMATLTSLGFLHISASDQWVNSHATMMGSSVALYSIEQIQYTLDQMAAILEGRAPAGRMAS